jgi:predicted AAA+ superfamily ATPase
MESLVRNLSSFSRFLESVSFSHASILNISDIARDCQVGRKTVEGYISIQEDLLLSFRIHVFSKQAKRKLSSHPKFYFFDAGVFRSLRPRETARAHSQKYSLHPKVNL